MATISKFTDDQLTIKIKNLLEGNFTKCIILDSMVSETITLNCNWDGYKYKSYVYIEEINNPNCKHQITIGMDSFPFSEKGIKEAVNYINK
tara:strand:+ start:223 stop:495 length:273 start_codon:yes stop_codon:yes gene_type:complete